MKNVIIVWLFLIKKNCDNKFLGKPKPGIKSSHSSQPSRRKVTRKNRQSKYLQTWQSFLSLILINHRKRISINYSSVWKIKEKLDGEFSHHKNNIGEWKIVAEKEHSDDIGNLLDEIWISWEKIPKYFVCGVEITQSREFYGAWTPKRDGKSITVRQINHLDSVRWKFVRLFFVSRNIEFHGSPTPSINRPTLGKLGCSENAGKFSW